MNLFKINITLRSGASYNFVQDVPDSFFERYATAEPKIDECANESHELECRISLLGKFILETISFDFRKDDTTYFVFTKDIEVLSISLFNGDEEK